MGFFKGVVGLKFSSTIARHQRFHSGGGAQGAAVDGWVMVIDRLSTVLPAEAAGVQAAGGSTGEGTGSLS